MVRQVPFESIREALGVEEEVLKRILHSLSCGKYQVRGEPSAVTPTSARSRIFAPLPLPLPLPLALPLPLPTSSTRRPRMAVPYLYPRTVQVVVPPPENLHAQPTHEPSLGRVLVGA